MRVGVVAVTGCFDSGYTSVIDVLRAANAARKLVDAGIPRITVRAVGRTAEPVTTAGGLRVPVDVTFDEVGRSAEAGGDGHASLDVLVIPAIGAAMPMGIDEALRRTTALSLDQIASRVGYRRASSLRALLRTTAHDRGGGDW